MNGKNISNYTNIKPRILIFSIASVVAINLFFYPSAADPFNTPKLVLLLILTSLLLPSVFIVARNWVTIERRNLIVIFTPIIFLSSLLVAAINSEDRATAFFGELQRRLGWVTYLCLVLIFIFFSRSVNISNVRLVFKAGIINNLLLSTYGCIQFIGRDFVQWNNPYNSIIGTLGNPNFASATLAILTVISLTALLIKDIGGGYKSLAILSSFLAIFAIIASESRQGLVTLFLSMSFYFMIIAYKKSHKIGLIVLIPFFIGFVLSVSGMLQKGPLTSILYKPSVTLRGYYWDAGLSMFRDNPLSGVGVDMYGDFFRAYRSVEYPLRYGFEISTTNAHNVFIQFFATAGIFTGSAYVFLFILILFFTTKLLRQVTRAESYKVAGIFAAWIGFQAQSVISIDNIGLSLWGWLLGGALLGIFINHNKFAQPLQTVDHKKDVFGDLQVRLISYFIALPLLIISLFLGKSELDTFSLSRITSGPSVNREGVENKILQIQDNSIAHPSYKLYATRVEIAIQGNWSQNRNLMALAKQFPRNTEIVYTQLNYALEDQNLQQQIVLRNKIVELDPWNLVNYSELLSLYKSTGRLDLAKQALKQMSVISPDSEQTKSAQLVLNS